MIGCFCLSDQCGRSLVTPDLSESIAATGNKRFHLSSVFHGRPAAALPCIRPSAPIPPGLTPPLPDDVTVRSSPVSVSCGLQPETGAAWGAPAAWAAPAAPAAGRAPRAATPPTGCSTTPVTMTTRYSQCVGEESAPEDVSCVSDVEVQVWIHYFQEASCADAVIQKH